MLNLDSIKISFDSAAIQRHSNQFLSKSTWNADGEIMSESKQLSKIDCNGFKSVSIDSLNGKTTIELSAKILKENYHFGINKNTIENVISNINRHGAIQIDSNKFLDSAEICRCDITDNIKPDNNGEMFFKTLSIIPIATKYQTDLWNTPTNLGVVYKGKQTSIRERIIFYDKIKDINKDKEIRNSPYAHKLNKDFKGVVRVESNHSKFKDLRHLFGTRKLNEVLQTDKKVNYEMFSRITKKTTDIDLRLFNQFEGMRYNEIRKYLGDKGIIEVCGFEWIRVELFLKTFTKHNYRHYKQDLKKVFNSLKQATKQTDINIIEHIKQLLYAA